ncbi:SGNH/GDSL hydrolase family protein [Burkholderia glumae]
MKKAFATIALLCSAMAHAADSQCFIEDPKANPTCIVDANTLKRSIIQYGDDSRLWKVFRKAEAGKPIVIAAIGGSITQGAWATSPDKNYVSRVFGWWQATFPKSKMTLVNAGIGQTDSKFGNERLQKDLLDKKPDFVITEWANNDAGTPEMRASYKKVVERILALPTHPAVLMLFTMDRKWSNSEDNQIPIGKELNVPMVALREAIMPIEKSGQMNPLDRTADPIHPNDLGHQIIAELVAYRLQSGLNNMHAAEKAKK